MHNEDYGHDIGAALIMHCTLYIKSSFTIH